VNVEITFELWNFRVFNERKDDVAGQDGRKAEHWLFNATRNKIRAPNNAGNMVLNPSVFVKRALPFSQRGLMISDLIL